MNERNNFWGRVAGIFDYIFPSCQHASRLQSEDLDRKLPAGRKLGLLFHLLFCRWCRRYGSQIRFLRAAAQKAADRGPVIHEQMLSPGARERIKQAIERQKREEN